MRMTKSRADLRWHSKDLNNGTFARSRRPRETRRHDKSASRSFSRWYRTRAISSAGKDTQGSGLDMESARATAARARARSTRRSDSSHQVIASVRCIYEHRVLRRERRAHTQGLSDGGKEHRVVGHREEAALASGTAGQRCPHVRRAALPVPRSSFALGHDIEQYRGRARPMARQGVD